MVCSTQGQLRDCGATHGILVSTGQQPHALSTNLRETPMPLTQRLVATRSLARGPIDSSTARASTARSRPLLRFAELQDELVGMPANRRIEHFGRTGVSRVSQNRTLGVELESRSFNLTAHGRGLDAMQGLGYVCRSTQSGRMIENHIHATGLQRTVDGLVKRADVDRAHELVV